MTMTEVGAAGKGYGIAVIGGNIYGAFRGPTDQVRRVWVSFAGPSTMAAGHVLHAVTRESVKESAARRRRTFDTTCGVRAKPRVHGLVSEGAVIAPWPPRVGDLPAGWVRCGTCRDAHPQSLRDWDGFAEVFDVAAAAEETP